MGTLLHVVTSRLLIRFENQEFFHKIFNCKVQFTCFGTFFQGLNNILKCHHLSAVVNVIVFTCQRQYFFPRKVNKNQERREGNHEDADNVPIEKQLDEPREGQNDEADEV